MRTAASNHASDGGARCRNKDSARIRSDAIGSRIKRSDDVASTMKIAGALNVHCISKMRTCMEPQEKTSRAFDEMPGPFFKSDAGR
ncbi:MAG TPA: hypothetical protein VFW05_03310 [Verrucomicrobiae bacterium]|nr:hypothetical protein [Verrucomicrobiae bacterium]